MGNGRVAPVIVTEPEAAPHAQAILDVRRLLECGGLERPIHSLRRTSMNCPTCAQALSERGSFCKFCGTQARCLNCRAILEPDAIACVECGAKVGERPNADPI